MVSTCKLHHLLRRTRCATAQPSETSEVIEALEDSQMALGSMASNRYAAPFREAVAGWLGQLGVVGEQLESWLAVQALWMYMEAVFSGGDIVKQLPAEAKRFQNIDKNFMKVPGGPCMQGNVGNSAVQEGHMRA